MKKYLPAPPLNPPPRPLPPRPPGAINSIQTLKRKFLKHVLNL